MVKNPPLQSLGDLGGEDHLEKERATHSRTLDWEIPRTEKPGGYSPWDRRRVRHELATIQQFLFSPQTLYVTTYNVLNLTLLPYHILEIFSLYF